MAVQQVLVLVQGASEELEGVFEFCIFLDQDFILILKLEKLGLKLKMGGTANLTQKSGRTVETHDFTAKGLEFAEHFGLRLIFLWLGG